MYHRRSYKVYQVRSFHNRDNFKFLLYLQFESYLNFKVCIFKLRQRKKKLPVLSLKFQAKYDIIVATLKSDLSYITVALLTNGSIVVHSLVKGVEGTFCLGDYTDKEMNYLALSNKSIKGMQNFNQVSEYMNNILDMFF